MDKIIGFTLLVVIIGLTLGLALGGLNPWKSPAEAERIRAEVAHQGVMNTLEEQLAMAKTDAEIASINRQQELEQKRYEAELKYLEELYPKKLAAYGHWVQVRDTLLLAFGFSGSASLFLFVMGKVLANLRSAKPSQLSPSPRPAQTSVVIRPVPIMRRPAPDYSQMRINAKQNELLSRNIMLRRMQAVHSPAAVSREQYNKLPLAG